MPVRAAVIDGGVVTNIILIEKASDAPRFGAIHCPDDVAKGDLFDGANFTPQPVADQLGGLSSADRKSALTDYAARKRWEKSISGTRVDLGSGVVEIKTDANSQLAIATARAKAESNAKYEIPNFRLGPAKYVKLDAASIVAVADAVESHIQDCFRKNEEVDKKIMSGKIKTFADIEDAFSAG